MLLNNMRKSLLLIRKNILGIYILNILVSIDQFVNVIFGGAPDETISSRLGRNYPNSILYKIVNFIFFWQENHCEEEIEPESHREDAIVRK